MSRLTGRLYDSLLTGFLAVADDQSHRRGEPGAVFGIPLSQCVSQHEHPAAARTGSASSVAAAVSSGHGGGGGGLGFSARRKRSTASGTASSVYPINA